MAKSKPAVDPLDDLEEVAAPKAAKAAAKPAKAAPKKATQEELDEVFKDDDKEAAAPKAKGKRIGVAKNDLAGKVLVQVAETCAKIKGDSLRAEAIAPFKGNGMKYETAIAKLAVSMVPRRGGRAEAGASEAFAIDMVRTMVRLGFLAAK